MALFKFEGNRGYALNDTGGITVTNTTAETNLFSAVIPGGKMGSNKILKFEIVVHITTPALSIPTLTLKLKFGSFTLVLANTAILNLNVTDKPVIIEGKIMNISPTSQFIVAKMLNNTSGINILSALSSAIIATDATSTVNTAVDQTLALTATFGGLNASTSITTKIVEINLT